MDREDAAYHLNDLVQINLDAYEGFLHAAENVSHEGYADMFREAAGERRQFVDQLQKQVISMGHVPDQNSTLGGALQRLWMNIRQALSADDTVAVMSEIEGSEKAALDTYQHVLDTQPLPPEVDALIRQQHLVIRDFYERIRTIRLALSGQSS
jgi:uncharacterized protein (TIGR02284 family)